jgi:hypothetical protein
MPEDGDVAVRHAAAGLLALGALQASRMWQLATEKNPFFTLAVAASVVTFVVQRCGGSLAVGGCLPLGARSANALISYCRYLGKLFRPTDLAVFYPHLGIGRWRQCCWRVG